MSLPANLLVPLAAGVGALAGAGLTILSAHLAAAQGLAARAPHWERIATPLLSGLVLASLAWRLGGGWSLLSRSLWALILIQIIVFDLRHGLILDRVLLPAGLLAALMGWSAPGLGWRESLLTGALTGLAFLALAGAGRALFQAEALGLGDVKLSAFMGLCLGFPGVVWAVIAGVLAGGVAAAVLLITGRAGRRDHFAYGPFLAGGSLLALFLLPAGRT
ncbi:MAG: A24 family peptidase [Candidatus Dormibacteraeota bacterium]|nr:A24 family peptidase [Candidatus Dormibacteraeota bacterium]